MSPEGETPAARAMLICALGLSLSALVFSRWMASNNPTALLSWVGAMATLLGFAWRADALRPPRPMRAIRSRRELVLCLFVFAGCAALRFGRLGDVPPMVHGDSAECGILGVELLQGQAPDVFAFSPWYWTPYVSFLPYAASFWLDGVSVAGLRVPSALLGTLAVVPLYALVRASFGVRPALVASALYATSHTAIHFGRIGLWNIQVLFYAVSALALVVLGLRRRSAVWLTAAGLISGLALYSYTAGRLVPVIVGAVFARHLAAGNRRNALRGLAYFASAVGVTLIPLALNYVRDPSMFANDRTASVWVFAEANRPHVEATLGTTSLPAVISAQVVRTLQGFYSLGDASGQYGTVQPILSPLTAVLAAIGLWFVVRRWREPRCFLLATWLGLGLLLGSVLIIDPPSHTRLIAVLPVPYILAAVGIEACLRATARWRLRGADMAALCLLVVVQGSAFSLLGYRQFVREMTLRATEWDVLKQMERLGGKYDYYLFSGPFLLSDAPVIRLFSAGTRAVSAFGVEDLPERLFRDSVFLVLPEYRGLGPTITRRFPGIERDIVDQEGVRQMAIYTCSVRNGCRRSEP